MTHELSVFVPGVPAPGGSKKAFVIAGRARIVDDCKKSRPWKDSVAAVAGAAWGNRPLLYGALRVEFTFNMPRIGAHRRANGTLKPNAPMLHTKKPDCTKLIRSTEDALTGVVIRDDAMIAEQVGRKIYAEKPGVHIAIFRIEEPSAPTPPA